ncbi:hypothetical protein [Parasitella parasitica]|uniref:Uncharacterized protein n=1 Tax=Parasitella parasitica TaxID=35722 RepID=A0A0B7NVE1_9FUNG|nr:hypothetical protein [Parasitella parasitica]
MASLPNSIDNSANNVISHPPPTLLTNHYPTAPTILPSSDTPTPSLQLTLKENIPTRVSSTVTVPCTTISNHNGILYYYREPPIYENSQENQDGMKELLLLLYDIHKNPIWKLENRDWHGMTLIHENSKAKLSATPPQFRFTLNGHLCHWQIQPQNSLYSLKCFQTETKVLIAELNQNELNMYHQKNEYNPFRKLAQIDHYTTTLVILTGLLANHYLKHLLKSLDGEPEALKVTVDPSQVHINSSKLKSTPGFQHDEEEEDDDIASLSYYPGHQNLVDDGDPNSRWSASAKSFKSIELDPGLWHCWWGYTFWWSWFPFCMPGGYCDKARFRSKGRNRPKIRTSRTLSKQGWQQQHY